MTQPVTVAADETSRSRKRRQHHHFNQLNGRYQRLALWLCLLMAIIDGCQSAVLIADYSMSRMVELIAKRPFCKLHTDRGDIQRMLLNADPKKIRQVPRDNVIALEAVCQETGGLSAELQGGLGFIYPGTKWCGPGTLATDYNDLGRYVEEDKCCREHDLCPSQLSPGECKRGLCNTQPFTRSHCDCDARFRRCLQGLNTETANTLGAAFFNVVQVTCFRERRPCSDRQSNCPLQMVTSDLYTNAASGPSPYYTSPYPYGGPFQALGDFGRSLVDRNLVGEERVRLASYGLIARNLFKDIVVRQVQGFTQFYSKTRDLIDGDGSAGYSKNQTDVLCSQWKYRPSDKYLASLPYKS